MSALEESLGSFPGSLFAEDREIAGRETYQDATTAEPVGTHDLDLILGTPAESST